MNAIAHGLRKMDDRDSFDVEYLRDAIRLCLAGGDVLAGSATFADMQTRRVKGERKLSRPKGTYQAERINKDTGEVEEVARVKPEHGQWTTITHATATRPAGRSTVPLDEGPGFRRRYTIHALWGLNELHVVSLLARYGTRARRREKINALATTLAKRFRGESRRRTAQVIATMLLWGYQKEAIRESMKITKEDWRATRIRRLFSDVQEVLTRVDVDSLRAWESECFRLAQRDATTSTDVHHRPLLTK